MKLRPPLQVDEIAVSHRVGEPKPVLQDTNAEPSPPRPLLVKFVSRWTKERVMAQKKELRGRDPKRMRADHTQEDDRSDDDVEYDENQALLPAVFMTDDLT